MKLSFKKFVAQTCLVASVTISGVAFAESPVKTAVADENVIPLYKKQNIEDHVIGGLDSKVTIVEYASLTCPHCANFHINTFKKFKKEYVETGKVKFIYRNFHLDNIALAGALLAECAPKDQFYSIIDLIFTNQQKWIRAEKQFGALTDTLKLAGYSDAKVKECFAKKSLISGLLDDRKYASETLKVNGTPSIFINGEKQNGVLNYAELTQIVDKLLAE